MIRTARVYELSTEEPGTRWLVDRLWPRGLRKASLDLAGWAREAAPSDELRRWFGHDPARWAEFRQRYEAELAACPAAWQPLLEAARNGDLLLLHAARDVQHNNAVVLADHLRDHLRDQVPAASVGDGLDGGGDPVCWLHLLCPSCGHLDETRASTCPRCGAAVVQDAEG